MSSSDSDQGWATVSKARVANGTAAPGVAPAGAARGGKPNHGGGGGKPKRPASSANAQAASPAAHKKPIQRNCIYTAIPDRHLMIDNAYMYTPAGPKENRVRPAIAPLFRSAAVSQTSCVTGIILTGMLDDGTSGLMAIKQCGGLAIVQDP